MDDDPWIVAKVLLTDRERIAAAILILSLEEDGDFISANSGPASDGESPLASRRQPVIAEGVRIALDTVRLAQRDLLDAAPAFVRHRHRKVGRVDAVMTRIKIQGPARHGRRSQDKRDKQERTPVDFRGWHSRLLLDRVDGLSKSQGTWTGRRSEEHTSELQSLMRISYAVFCLKK